MKTLEMITFKRALPQGDACCLRLFTLFLNAIAWNLKASEAYKLSKRISLKTTHLLYIDDLKVFAASESKLLGVLRSVKVDMESFGLKWKGKCAVAQRVSDSRCEDRTSESTKFDSFKLNTTLSNVRLKQSKIRLRFNI